MPPELAPDAVREWNRLVTERQAQPAGIFPEDAFLLYLASTTFCYRMTIERLLQSKGLKYRPEYASPDWKPVYLAACHALGCTPAIPILQEGS